MKVFQKSQFENSAKPNKHESLQANLLIIEMIQTVLRKYLPGKSLSQSASLASLTEHCMGYWVVNNQAEYQQKQQLQDMTLSTSQYHAMQAGQNLSNCPKVSKPKNPLIRTEFLDIEQKTWRRKYIS